MHIHSVDTFGEVGAGEPLYIPGGKCPGNDCLTSLLPVYLCSVALWMNVRLEKWLLSVPAVLQ